MSTNSSKNNLRIFHIWFGVVSCILVIWSANILSETPSRASYS